jgi:hypothetical protein
VALQGDGSITRQRQMATQPSMEACRTEAKKQTEASRSRGGRRACSRVECHEMATLEVVRPPQPKKPAEDSKPPRRGTAT